MDDSVFPAYAGVILMNSNRESLIRGFPRVCGGDPPYSFQTLLV